MDREQEKACVAGFVEALRQFADYVENEPGMAVLDSGGDLFVAASDLSYSDGFKAGLREERKQVEPLLGRLSFGGWLYAFTGWCGAVAQLAYRLKQKEPANLA